MARESNIKGIQYDSEAGMFCAYSKTSDNLLQLCHVLCHITGDESAHVAGQHTKPRIALDTAEKLLLKGFVKSLDREAQKEFLENSPMPSLSKNQAKYVHDIYYGTDEEKIQSAKRINSEARTKTGDWNNYLSHPDTISTFLKAIDTTENIKVLEELLRATMFICMRHLPDLRTQYYFIKALTSKQARMRELGLRGLDVLYDYPVEVVLPLIHDKSYLVRRSLLRMINRKDYYFSSWMFDPTQKRINKRPKDFVLFYPLFEDKHREVQTQALGVILRLEEIELFPKLKELLPVYHERMAKEDNDYIHRKYQQVIERLEHIK